MDFKERFGINPPVKYLESLFLPKKCSRDFKKKYGDFFKKYKNKLTKTRIQHFEIFFRRLKREKNDTFYCKRVNLKYINKKLGYGVFAKENIPPYTTLHFYAGEIILTKKLNPDHDSTFSFEFFDAYSIDAMHKGNWTRFMNHSDISSPSCNVCVWEYYREDFPYIIFTSGKNGIKKGKQLLYSYGDEYWEDRPFQKLK